MTRAIAYAVLVCALMLTGLVAYDLQQRDALLPSKESTKTTAKDAIKAPVTKVTDKNSNSNAQKAAVSIQIKGIRTSKGQIIAQLYDDMHAFNNNRYDKALSTITVPAKGFSGSLLFEQLSNKQYALVLFHDENSNNRFDQIGTVLEGYGYSNNVGKTALPNFQQAAFVANKDKSLTINMIYH